MIRDSRYRAALALCVFLWAPEVAAQAPEQPPRELSLMDLMNVEASIASKANRRVFETPAAVFVITHEDIRRSGATSIPELLRLVPGVQVSRIDANKWAISIRGFTARFSNKLLVLIDGRSVYTTRSGGVDWDVQDLLMEDIERVEVLRGPGAAIWGANAVNGVINIVTKPVKTTTGGFVVAKVGSAQRGSGGFRFGTRVGDGTHVRAYAKAFTTEPFQLSDGSRAADDWDMLRAGFRLDRALSARSDVFVQADVYSGEAGDTLRKHVSLTGPILASVNTRTNVSGGNVLTRWSRSNGHSDLTAQLYVDHSDRTEPTLDEARTVVDAEFTVDTAVRSRHKVVAGGSFRVTSDRLRGGFLIDFTPAGVTERLATVFAQEDISLVRDRLRLVGGAKAEWHESGGLALQPNARLIWTPSPTQAAWAAVSRALRMPARVDTHFQLVNNGWRTATGMPMIVRVSGNPVLDPDDLLAYEAGYRIEAGSRTYIDVTAFYNVYDDLRTSEAGSPVFEATPGPPHLVLPIQFQNLGYGATYGAELAVSTNLTPWWMVSGWGAWMEAPIRRRAGSTDTFMTAIARGNHPNYHGHVRSYLDLPGGWAVDTLFYASGPLENLAVPGYQRADVQVRWQPTRQLTFGAGVENLFEARHLEFRSVDGIHVEPTYIPRSAVLSVACRF